MIAIINDVILNCPNTNKHGASIAEINGIKANIFINNEPSNTPAIIAR